MRLIAETKDRVESQGSIEQNERFRADIEMNLRHYAERIEQIEARIRELDREWDVERVIEANASTLILVGLTLGLADRRFNILPAVVAGFLLQHAIQGWCPPIPILRRLGVRTLREIDMERYGLKALRGDFEGVQHAAPGNAHAKARRVLQAVE